MRRLGVGQFWKGPPASADAAATVRDLVTGHLSIRLSVFVGALLERRGENNAHPPWMLLWEWRRAHWVTQGCRPKSQDEYIFWHLWKTRLFFGSLQIRLKLCVIFCRLLKIKEYIDKNDPGAIMIPMSAAFELTLSEMGSDEERKAHCEENKVTRWVSSAYFCNV